MDVHVDQVKIRPLVHYSACFYYGDLYRIYSAIRQIFFSLKNDFK